MWTELRLQENSYLLLSCLFRTIEGLSNFITEKNNETLASFTALSWHGWFADHIDVVTLIASVTPKFKPGTVMYHSRLNICTYSKTIAFINLMIVVNSFPAVSWCYLKSDSYSPTLGWWFFFFWKRKMWWRTDDLITVTSYCLALCQHPPDLLWHLAQSSTPSFIVDPAACASELVQMCLRQANVDKLFWSWGLC